MTSTEEKALADWIRQNVEVVVTNVSEWKDRDSFTVGLRIKGDDKTFSERRMDTPVPGYEDSTRPRGRG